MRYSSELVFEIYASLAYNYRYAVIAREDRDQDWRKA